MALINCPECGKSVSDKASICVNCGFPISSKKEEKSTVNTDISEEIISILSLEEEPVRDISIQERLANSGYVISREELSHTLEKLIDINRVRTVYDGALKYELQESIEKVDMSSVDKYKRNVQESQQEPDVVKCPKCGSKQIQLLNRKWSPIMGVFTNKIDRVCVNCKARF